jgi:uncharacterized protein (DUF302 family)
LKRDTVFCNQSVQMNFGTDHGIVTVRSWQTVDQTVETLKNLLREKSIEVFAVIDHNGGAEKVGLQMRPTKLLIFGNAKGGTPLMVASPSAAIDLPLKVLVAEDAKGEVWMSYNSPAYLQWRHDLTEELLKNIAIIEVLVAKAAESHG